mmetsp:Transcript_17934/g.50182  ORF Transcript_17934/g.50182 Transcript_17934/m.50182 type:complete len:212 (-) Transcript_17934:2864-3499(-)
MQRGITDDAPHSLALPNDHHLHCLQLGLCCALTLLLLRLLLDLDPGSNMGLRKFRVTANPASLGSKHGVHDLVSMPLGIIHWSATIAIQRVDIDVHIWVLNEVVCHHDAVLAAGQVDGTSAIIVLQGPIHADFQQCLHVIIEVFRCNVTKPEGHLPTSDLPGMLHQVPHNRSVPGVHSILHWCLFILVRLVHKCTLLNEVLHHLQVALGGS